MLDTKLWLKDDNILYQFWASTEWIRMNTKDHFCLNRDLLPAIAFTSQIFGVVRPFGENVDFLVRSDLTFKQILITKPTNSSSTQP